MKLEAAGKKRKSHALWFAFGIPFFGMLFIMLVSQYEPFGKYSMLYSDMYHQYYPFFVEFRRVLRGGGSLLYNWSVGMGMDYLGLIAYYLASPLNLLGVLVPEGWLLEFYSLLMPLKLGLAGLSFALFLRGIFGKNNLSIAMFGSFYALCAWALGFQWNIMWLDTFALLPLVALGTVYLLRDRRFGLYTLTLFLSIFSNYYVGLFTCIFVFLLFFCYEICRFRGWKDFFGDLLRIALFSALAIGMTAILELPALMALGNTQSSVNKFPTDFRLNMTTDHTFKGLLAVMGKVTGNLGGAQELNFKEGLPNLYCGVGTLLLAVLYFFNRDIKVRDKLCCLFLLTFLELSFIIRQLDYIWHGFHFTNMIPYRFSFLYSFVLLYMAYRSWISRNTFHPWQTLGAGVITAGLLACSENLTKTEVLDLSFAQPELPVYLIYNSVFLILYLSVLLYGQIRRRLPEDAQPEQIRQTNLLLHHRRVLARGVALGIIGVELLAALGNFGIQFTGTNTENYPRGTEGAASMVRYMKERERHNLFYRAETTHSQTLNDGALNGYRGISAFTSSANVKVTEFMKDLGYSAKNTYNRYCFEESSPVSNLFLGLKYMLEREGRDRSSAVFTKIHGFGGVDLLENNFYLPLGFLAEPELGSLDFSLGDESFGFQNQLFSAATGLPEPVWLPAYTGEPNYDNQNVTIDSLGDNGQCGYTGGEETGDLTYYYEIERPGFLCIRLDLPKRNNFHVNINGSEVMREKISLPQMLAVGDVQPGDQVEIVISIPAKEHSTIRVTGAVLDLDQFRRGYEILNACTLNLTTFRDTLVEGYVECGRDGLLYTSIPQNGNWQVMVDNRPGDQVLVGDAMLGIPLTEGAHMISLRYRNPAFSLGWKVTALCFGTFILLWHLDRKKRR